MAKASEGRIGLDYSSLQKQVNKYFENQLESLGLSVSALEQQSEEELRRNLIVVKQAIENHQSFGKFSIGMSAEGGAFIAMAKSVSHFEIGILPLLIERYQIILNRLDEFDQKKKSATDDDQTHLTKIKNELFKIAQGETILRLWVVIGILVIVWGIMYWLIQTFGWNLLEPWTYLLSIALAIGGYLYFALKQREFSPWTIYQHSLETRKNQLFRVFGIEEL